ncbi:MAG: HI0074 family nucleotidyltransferase substrate-binding subunit [Legionellaceae bacterium]|nr:HI0074 family nucleotidyltransferase substrate-binding subunit [Legionellaceae bacterium]
MERLRERVKIAERALKTFAELTPINEPTQIERDAMIQRFEYSFEAIWKAVKRYLYVVEGLEANSPKSTIRASFDIMLLNEEQAKQAMVMADDRNLTSHTYNEGLADELLTRMQEHENVLTLWLSEIKRRVDGLL